MKTNRAPDSGRGPAAVTMCEMRHDIFAASTADYVYGVTMHRGRWVATFHGAGCHAITGYTPEEMDRDPSLWSRMIHDEDRGPVLNQLSRIFNSEDLPPIEHRIITKTGKLRWIRNVPVLQRDGPGGVVSYNGVISDITDRKQAKIDLEQTHNELTKKGDDLTATTRELRASDAKLKNTELELIQSARLESVGRLAAGVAHEVKNPLQTMLMGLDYLSSNLGESPQPIKDALADMRDAVKRASVIVQGLLELAVKSNYETQPEDLNACVLRSLDLIRYELQAAQIDLVLDLGQDLPTIPMDSAKLEQAFINIFLNAIQAMGHHGTMSVKTSLDRSGSSIELGRDASTPPDGHKMVLIEVKDSGPGIPETDLAKIFDPFFTTKPVGTGTGLGLSIVRKIVHLHGGGIRIENAPEGGALVTIILRSTRRMNAN